MIATFDFETYSEAGFTWSPAEGKWIKDNSGSKAGGLPSVGASVYTEHPSAEVISMAYDLKDGVGRRLWLPTMPNPQDLFDYLAKGGLIEGHNVMFERLVWANICRPKYGWPALPEEQLRCSDSKARSFSLPGSLDKLSDILNIRNKKLKTGKNLIRKFTIPRNPTKTNPARRMRLEDAPADGAEFLRYNIFDIRAEEEVSSLLPELSPYETKVWFLDQRINWRGMAVDLPAVHAFESIISEYKRRMNRELVDLTGGQVASVKCPKALATFLGVDSVAKASIAELKKKDLTPLHRRVVEIREQLSLSSIDKLESLRLRTSMDGRIRGLFQFCGADRTGRFAGRGPQPQNLPNSGTECSHCLKCRVFYTVDSCPLCGGQGARTEWGVGQVEFTIHLALNSDLDNFLRYFRDPLATISGCLRGLFGAGTGKELICSDYSAIEAVALAMLAGEQWREDVFRTHGKIYEMSASKITGVPLEEMLQHKKDTGDHHPLRKKVGKISELASGYGGGVAAWKVFGADKHLNDPDEVARVKAEIHSDQRRYNWVLKKYGALDESVYLDELIMEKVKAWREASPMIVKFWYGLQECAINAIQNPNSDFTYRSITYHFTGGILYCWLPSGRHLQYHSARLDRDRIMYQGWNSDSTKGPVGWMWQDTWGGKLAENVTQAVCRDILVDGMLRAEEAGYDIVLHVHDEPCAEVFEGWGSVEEFENIISTMPEWCKDWPIKASGGWRGKRYRKD